MKIKQGFTLKNENGQNVIICDKSINRDFNATIYLTETLAFLWHFIQDKTVTKEDMLNALLNNFDVSTVLALNDIDIFIRTLKENGILENEK